MKIDVKALALKAGFEEGTKEILLEGFICTDEVTELVRLVLRAAACEAYDALLEYQGDRPATFTYGALMDMAP